MPSIPLSKLFQFEAGVNGDISWRITSNCKCLFELPSLLLFDLFLNLMEFIFLFYLVGDSGWFATWQLESHQFKNPYIVSTISFYFFHTIKYSLRKVNVIIN